MDIKKFIHLDEDKEFKEIMEAEGSRIAIISWNNEKKKVGFSFGNQVIDLFEFFLVLQDVENSIADKFLEIKKGE